VLISYIIIKRRKGKASNNEIGLKKLIKVIDCVLQGWYIITCRIESGNAKHSKETN